MNKLRLFSALMLLYFTAASCRKDSQAQVPHQPALSALTQRIADSTDLMATVFSDTSFQVSEGIRETDVHYLSKEGYAMHIFILEVALNTPKLKLEAATPYNVDAYALQTVPDMAKYLQAAEGRVLAGVNADFFSTAGEPRGILVRNGKVLKTTWANERSRSYLAVRKDGKVVMGDREDFAAQKSDLEDALGGGPMLVKNNEILSQTDLSIEPRTGVGLSADGSKLYFIVVDGRSFYYSNGITITALGHMLRACGATTAINVDGGGSSTFLIKHPLADVWQVRNRPSDGTNRAVGNAWMIVSKP